MGSGKLLRHWFATQLGREVMALEQEKFSLALAGLFGYYIVQIGALENGHFMADSRIKSRTVMLFDEEHTNTGDTGFIGVADALAIASDSVDVVLLPHVLEVTDNPHKVLREVERVLIGDGNVIISGFNPWSIWGIARLFLAWRELPPWSGHFYSLIRIRDWLSLLDFEIIDIKRFFFRPPVQNKTVLQRLLFLEKLGNYCWPWFGGIYLIIAKKRVFPVSPIKLNWLEKRRLITSGLTKPSARCSELQGHEQRRG